jgi:hypothetical protein
MAKAKITHDLFLQAVRLRTLTMRSKRSELFKQAFPFYAECVKAGGMVCPRCGSKNVQNWSKSDNYYYDGGSCMDKKCDLGCSWAMKGKSAWFPDLDLKRNPAPDGDGLRFEISALTELARSAVVPAR